MIDFRMFRCGVLALGIFLSLPAPAGVYDDIIAAANRDDTAQVIDLLKRGMDVNTADRSGNSLLMIAARNANHELLDFLVGNRANLSRKNRYGDSALMLAAFRGDVRVVLKLLAAGARIGDKGWNALHYSAFNGQAEVVRMLAANTPDLDGPAPNGQTALMLAAKSGKLDVVRMLVDAGAGIDVKGYDGKTAVQVAEEAGQAEAVEYLRGVGGK